MTTQAAANLATPDPFAELDRKRRPWWLLVVALIIAAVAGAVIYRKRHPPPAPPRFLTARVSMGEVNETIEATGAAQPLLQVQISSQVSGRIRRVLVDFNSEVHAGD